MPYVLQNPKGGKYWTPWNRADHLLQNAKFYDSSDTTTKGLYKRVDVTVYDAGYYGLWRMLADRDGDEWGWAMSWMFPLCDHLLFDRDVVPPSEWGFKPSPMGKGDGDEFKHEVLAEMCIEQLTYIGNVLNRYIAALKRQGKDY